MALSTKAKKRFEVAMARRAEAQEILAAIESGVNPQAASVAAIGVTNDIPPASVSLSTSNTYTDAAVATAIEDAINGVTDDIENRLDNLEAKVNELIAALKTAGIMAT
jgi:hypothetical protein